MSDNTLGLSRLPNMRIPAAETPRPEALLGLATGVVIVAALVLARDVLIPITLAIFLSFFLAPLVRRDAQNRRRSRCSNGHGPRHNQPTGDHSGTSSCRFRVFDRREVRPATGAGGRRVLIDELFGNG